MQSFGTSPTVGSSPPSSFRNGVYVPQMPWFEPSNEPSAKASLLSQTVGDGDHFSFPADRDFWNNFVTQTRLYPGAMDPPHFHVDASHTDESVLVNQEFLRRFVSGWERANPHVVKVNTPAGGTTFHASEEFWNRFVMLAGQRARDRAARGEMVNEDTLVQSSMFPGMMPIKTSQQDWHDICTSWEQEKGISPGQKQMQMNQRWAQIQQPGSGRASPIGNEDPENLLSLQNQHLDEQRGELAKKDAQLLHQAAQLNQIQRSMKDAQEQTELAKLRDQEALRQLEQAKSDAERYRNELEALRASQAQMQQGWERERSGLEDRLRNMEGILGQLQSDVVKQREQARAQIADRDQELHAARQHADIADLKKELQMRELMQEEICRAREDAQKEVDQKLQQEQMNRTQLELEEMRRMLRENAAQHQQRTVQPVTVSTVPASVCAPVMQPVASCMPMPSACMPAPAVFDAPPPPRTITTVTHAPQRTVATQTPPRTQRPTSSEVACVPATYTQPCIPTVSAPLLDGPRPGGYSQMVTPALPMAPMSSRVVAGDGSLQIPASGYTTTRSEVYGLRPDAPRYSGAAW